MAKTLKKALALFLAVVMVMSTVGMTSIFAAAEGAGEIQTGKVPGSEVITGITQGDPVSVNDGNLVLTKTVTQVGNSNEFDVSLAVKTTKQYQETVVSKPLAVCLVVDLSSSMDEYAYTNCPVCGNKLNGSHKCKNNGCSAKGTKFNQSRIDVVKSTTAEFVNSLPDSSYVSIVTFNSDASVNCDWKQLSENKDDVISAVNSLSVPSDKLWGYGTNTQKGFEKVKALFDNIDLEKKVTVLISDGKPTCAGEFDEAFISLFDAWDIGDGVCCSREVCEATLNSANAVPGSKYAVYIGNPDATCYYIEPVYEVTSYSIADKKNYDVSLNVCPHYVSQIANTVTTAEFNAIKKNHTYKDPGWFHDSCVNCENDGYTSGMYSNKHKTVYFKKNYEITSYKYHDSDASNRDSYSKYTLNNFLADVTGNSDNVKSIADAGALQTSLETVAKDIIKNNGGNDGQGWFITETLGDMFSVSNAGNVTVGSDGKTVTYQLDKTKAQKTENDPVTIGNTTTTTTTYTYTANYRIKMNTDAADFGAQSPYAISASPATLRKPAELVVNAVGADNSEVVATFNNPTISAAADYYYTANVWKEVDAGTANAQEHKYNVTVDGAAAEVTKYYVLADYVTKEARLGSKISYDSLISDNSYDFEFAIYEEVDAHKGDYTVQAGTNTIDFYYNRKPVGVTINRNYYTFGREADNTTPYTKDNLFLIKSTTATVSGYIGYEFTVTDTAADLTFDGNEYGPYIPYADNVYTIDNLSSEAADNVITLNYLISLEEGYDKRAKAGFVINAHYAQQHYYFADVETNLGNGVTVLTQPVLGTPDYRYAANETLNAEGVVQDTDTKAYAVAENSDYKAYQVVPITENPGENYSDYELVEDMTVFKGGILSRNDEGILVATLDPQFITDESNGVYYIDLYFTKADDMPAEASVSVAHVYSTMNHKATNGDYAAEVNADAVTENVDFDNDTKFYVGQTIKVSKKTSDNAGNTYSFEGNEENLNSITLGAVNNISLPYSRSINTENFTQTVNHIYRDYHYETQYKYDEDENGETIPVGVDKNVFVWDDEAGTVVADSHYNKQAVCKDVTYSVALNTTYGDNEYVLDDEANAELAIENSVLTVTADANKTVNVYYKRDTGEHPDRRDTATYTVTGLKTEYKTHIVDGKIVVNDPIDKGSDVLIGPGEGHELDDFAYGDVEAEAVIVDEDGNYTLASDPISTTLNAGSNNYSLNYSRYADGLADTEATVAVTNEYYDVVMAVNEETNKTYYKEPELKAELTEAASVSPKEDNSQVGEDYAEYYAGQYALIADGAKNEYAADAAKYTNKTELGLSVGENKWTNKYYKVIDLPTVTIPVTHTYLSSYITADGENVEGNPDKTVSASISGYEGIKMTPELAPDGDYKLIGVKVIKTNDAGENETVKVFISDDYTGYETTLGKDGVTAIEYVYEYEQREATTCTVTYKYIYHKFYDNGNPYEDYPEDVVIHKAPVYVGMNYVQLDTQNAGYELTSATLNETTDIMDKYSEDGSKFELKYVADRNDIVLTFEKTEYRPTKVTVLHVYKKHDTFTGEYANDVVGDGQLYTIKQFFDGNDPAWQNLIYVGAKFEFDETMWKLNRDNSDVYSYSFVNAVPDGAITLKAQPVYNSSATPYEEEPVNLITATYSVDYSTQATGITVKHQYYTVGDITGNKTLVGSVVDARDNCEYLNKIGQGDTFTVQPKTAYNGNEYTCVTTILDEYTAGDNNEAQEIVLEYTREIEETIEAYSTVTHKYYVVRNNTTTYEGEQQSVETGNVKQTITVAAKNDYAGNTYALAPDTSLAVILGNGTNDIELSYYRYEYDVKFDLNGGDGTAPAAQIVKKDATASKPADPERDGFNFTGWKLGDKEFDFTTPVVGNITLLAQWEAKPEPAPETPVNYIVKFDLNGGTGTAPADQTVASGTTASKPADPVRDGFNFTGWTLDGAEYDFTAPVTADITLKASWQAKPEEVHNYVVKFDTNGGSDAPADQTVAEGGKAFKPADPTRYSYSFAGWLLNGAAYDFDAPVTADITLVADWTPAAPVNPTPNYPANYPANYPTNYPAVNPADSGETELPEPEIPLSELPDMEVPLGDLPEEELPEDEVPLAANPSVEEEELEEDLVPLGDAPATGDSGYIFLYAILMFVSACGLVAIALTSRKKREEN